ncbi:hypothetical protein ACHAPU_002652 [Fusarium lateritium]
MLLMSMSILIFAAILQSLRKIVHTPKSDDDPLGRDRWVMLCQGVQHLTHDATKDLLSQLWMEPDHPEKTRRPHRFGFTYNFNPWQSWFLWLKMNKFYQETRPLHGDDEDRFRRCLRRFGWWQVLIRDVNSVDLSYWYEVEYSEWESEMETFLGNPGVGSSLACAVGTGLPLWLVEKDSQILILHYGFDPDVMTGDNSHSSNGSACFDPRLQAVKAAVGPQVHRYP